MLDLQIGFQPIVDPPVLPAPVPLWQFKQSPKPLYAAQTLGSAPDVVILATGLGRMKLTREWQINISAINSEIAPPQKTALLGNGKAFCNTTGFGGETPRQNWIEGKDLGADQLPEFDKDRTCGLACHTGVEEFSALQVVKNFFTLAKDVVLFRHSVMSFKSSFRALANNNVLRITTFNGNLPPPPLSLINPRTHPWFYFHATVVYRNGGIGAFPIAKPAPAWGYARNVVLMPLVTTHPILYPLSLVTRVDSYRLPY